MFQDKDEFSLFCKVLERLASASWSLIPGGITMPNGFQAAGISAGLKASGKPDLALLLAPAGSICAGTFTQSLIRASCIDLCKERLQVRAGKVRAVLINSGQANACIGKVGLEHNLRATRALADRLGLLEDEVLISSTGVIGEPIPISNLLLGLKPLVESLSHIGCSAAAAAILTTDLVLKQVAFEAELGGKRVRIGGMAKGSGMIHPNMATMLAFLSCDVGVPLNLWEGMIKRVVASSFNTISVDGDTSTNDSCLAFSAGDPLEAEYFDALEEGLHQAMQHLAKAIARDGEGASCLVEVQVQGTDSSADAFQIARTISCSSLVKTAIYGCDPNWGRIVAAAGRAGVNFCSEELSLWIGPYQLMQAGEPLNFDRKLVSSYMQERKSGDYLVNDCVLIRLTLGSGEAIGWSWGCDLSEEYIFINSDYTT